MKGIMKRETVKRKIAAYAQILHNNKLRDKSRTAASD